MLRLLSEQEPVHREHATEAKGEVMPQYLIAGYQPDDFAPSTLTEEVMEEIHALNREMIAAGARKFACGLTPPA